MDPGNYICYVLILFAIVTEHNFTYYTDVPIFAMTWSPDDTRLVTSVVVSTQGLPKGGTSQSIDGPYVQIVQA